MKIERIDHVVLTVRDIERTMAFYVDVLGMESVSFGVNRKALKFGQQKINLHSVDAPVQPHAAQPTLGSVDLCFITLIPLPDVISHLHQAGVRIEEGPVQRTGATGAITSVYFRDPDGNLIEVSNDNDSIGCATLPAMSIREERVGDEGSIFEIHRSAFPGPSEGQLVHELRLSGRLLISLVAIVEDNIVGHIGFSPVTVGESNQGVGLAPLAVVPPFHRRGIGAALVRSSIVECQRRGFGFIVVLGDPHYYCRFGFRPASQWQLSDEYGGGDAFQVIELQAGAIPQDGGRVTYSSEFSVYST